MCENLEELYLLEFYVDVIRYKDLSNEANTGANSPDNLGETIVEFKYFGSNHVRIREEDFCPSTKPLKEDRRKVSLKSGKSCLFSLKGSKQLPKGAFDVVAYVYRKILNPEAYQIDDENDENWEDVSDKAKDDEDVVEKGEIKPKTEALIGRTDVSLYESFKYLKGGISSKESLAQDDVGKKIDDFVDTVDKSYKNGTAVVECHNFLRNKENTVTGEIVFLVRASCFGRTILTQFQLSEEEAKSYMYKRTDRNVCANRNGKGDGYKSNEGGDTDGEEIVGGIEKKTGEQGKVEECKGGNEGKCAAGQVKQGEKKVGGEKQSKPSKKPKLKQSGSPECPFGFNENGEMDLKTLCECVCKCVMNTVQNNQGSPPCSPMMPPKSGRDLEEIDPGSVGLVGNQMILRMPDKPDKLGIESKFTSSVYYTQNGENVGEDVGQVVNVRPEYPHMIAKDDPNAKQDVLVLKLGRKRIAAGKKPRIEIEMRTPKFRDDKPEMDSKETQYLASDLPKPSKPPKSAKSGKGGKKK